MVQYQFNFMNDGRVTPWSWEVLVRFAYSRRVRFSLLLFGSFGGIISDRTALMAQTVQHEKHSKFPELMQYYKAYEEALKKAALIPQCARPKQRLISIAKSPVKTIRSQQIVTATSAQHGTIKALKILAKLLGEDYVDVATSYNNLGSAYLNRGDYDKAIFS